MAADPRPPERYSSVRAVVEQRLGTMKETSVTVIPAKPVSLPTGVLDALRATRKAVKKRSQIVWGEHCTECAFPACYSACSYYTPRWDHHCRRFENGIERVPADPNRDLDVTRMQFRRWGKLEGRGTIALKSSRAASALERLDRLSDQVLAGPLPAFMINRVGGWLNRGKRPLMGLGDAVAGNDVFIIEAWHDGSESWPFTLTIMPDKKSRPGLYQTLVELAVGYNRILIPTADIGATVDLAQNVIIQIEPLREGSPEIVFGIVDFARLAELPAHDLAFGTPRVAPVIVKRPKFKCVVWDLDNTLWSGVLVEDGIEGVTLSEPAVALIRELDRRGIINSIASKNDPELAFAALERFGLRDLFVFPKIGWGPKNEGIKAIIGDMDVGADTFAFIDDQAFERGEIGELLPEVTVFSDKDISRLLDEPRFDVPVTAESGKRREMYQTEGRRIMAHENAAMDYQGFLRSCRIVLEVEPLTRQNLARMHELSQRTNQLNFSGLRYTELELEALMAERPQDTFVLSCSDRFGYYGAIGFCVLGIDGSRIESFFMSCRVQRKRVENAFFYWLGEELWKRGAPRLEVHYKGTAKNGASVHMLKEMGFNYEPGRAGEDVFAVALPHEFADHDIVQVEGLAAHHNPTTKNGASVHMLEEMGLD